MWRTQTQNAGGYRTNTNTVTFFQSDPLPSNSFRSFDYARGNESIFYFTDLCKPIETYIYARKKHPFASYPAAKHLSAADLRLQTYDKNQRTFFITRMGVNFSFRNYFKNSGSFAEVSIPVKIYNSLIQADANMELVPFLSENLCYIFRIYK